MQNDVFNQNFIVTNIRKVILVGKNEYPEHKMKFQPNLSHNELIFYLSGKSTVYFNGKILKTAENTIRFLPKGESKEYVVESEERGECIDVFFDTNLPLSSEAFVIKVTNDNTICNTFKKLFAVWVAKNDGFHHECMSLLYKIFSELNKQNYLSNSNYNKIQPAVEYIQKHFLEEKIPIRTLAEKCGISEVYLKKLFIKKFKVPPIKYIIQLKINYACDLLSLGQYSVTQVAELCNFTDVYFFSKQFKSYLGISPSTYVNKYKSSK